MLSLPVARGIRNTDLAITNAAQVVPAPPADYATNKALDARFRATIYNYSANNWYGKIVSEIDPLDATTWPTLSSADYDFLVEPFTGKNPVQLEGYEARCFILLISAAAGPDDGRLREDY